MNVNLFSLRIYEAKDDRAFHVRHRRQAQMGEPVAEAVIELLKVYLCGRSGDVLTAGRSGPGAESAAGDPGLHPRQPGDGRRAHPQGGGVSTSAL